ncbi:MAG: NAD(P)-binding protein [Actinobacteria bacterium]|nr:NAD(P)-binding protein [Actinomycetota bacterium]
MSEQTEREPRFDVLFEPMAIGPVVARNRFFQVPQCSGMGYRDVSSHAEMRAMKAQGGWAVVSTEQAEIHHSSEITPFIEQRIWDDIDIPALQLTVDRVHDHGSLAAIELCYNGMNGPNFFSRVAPMGPAHLPVAAFTYDPVQAREMTLDDIADLRRWHRQAVRRSIGAGFDIVYVYAGHALGGIHHFLSPRYNQRSDAYGGSIENRARLLRELLEDAVEEADGQAAIGCRISVDELIGDEGLQRHDIVEVIKMLGEIPDLWDFVLGSWEDDSVTSRFGPEAPQEQYVRGLKALTTKPVVGVGRFTSPETMLRMVREGVLDFIGAARPSIADPFLPSKIEAGQMDEIRECIGCNICVSGDFTMSPIRCTQNPSMGEEWRRGWHPETLRPQHADQKVLVLGAGPAGLEAAQALGKRGYHVVLAEATRDLGGRVRKESQLPGLAAWIRVVDWRLTQLDKLSNVEVFRQSKMTAQEILTYGFDHVAVATGATWRNDGVGRWHTTAAPLDIEVLTPDDLMAGLRPTGQRVTLFDDDHYYLGGVLAELLVSEGYDVTLVTPSPLVSSWTVNTLEIDRIQTRMREIDLTLRLSESVLSAQNGVVTTACMHTGRQHLVETDTLVSVTARLPNDQVAQDLRARQNEWADAGLQSVTALADALAPSTIAAAVWDGRRYAEDLGETINPDDSPFLREVTYIAHPQAKGQN